MVPRAAHRSTLIPLLLAATLIVPTAVSAWPHAPGSSGVLAHTPTFTSESAPITISDGAGGTIVLWQAGARTYAQRFDQDGNRQWGAAGVVVSGLNSYPVAAEADGAGGVVFLIGDLRNSGVTGTDLYIQRLNASGVAQWTANGVAVCAAVGEQYNSRLTVDVDGYAVMAWEDQRNLGATGNDIYTQRVSPSGVVQWAVNGLPLCVSTGNQTHPVVGAASPTSLGLHFAWQDARTDGGDIYFQGLSTSGVAQTPANGVLVHSSITTGTQSSPELVMDGGDRSMIVWVDDRAGTGAGDIYVQRLFLTGVRLFGLNGSVLCSATGACSAPAVASDGEGGVIVAWVDSRTGFSDIYVRRMDALGVARWTVDGVALCAQTAAQSRPVLVSDGYGGAFAAWRDQRSGRADVYARRVNAAGTPLWTADGVPVCTAALDQYDAVVARCGDNDLMVAWTDGRVSASQLAVYVQRVDEWGYLGAEPALQSVTDVPNDQGGKAKVSWDASPLDTDPLFRNVADYQVYRSAPPLSVSAERARAALPMLSARSGAAIPGTLYLQRTSAGENYWELLTTVAAAHLARYSVLAATSGDSIAGSNPPTAFLVMARTANGDQWWTSLADSGYSVDNLAPSAPAPLSGQYSAGVTALHWNRNSEGDLAGYRLYRGTGTGFATDPAHFVAELADTGHTDASGAPYVYKLTAIDSHGNESMVTTLVPAGTLDASSSGPTATLSLASPRPNPARPTMGTTVSFAVARTGVARLALLDAAGRLVRTLLDERVEAGEHAVRFDGRGGDGSALASGLYFVRLTTAEGSLVRRLALLQ